MAATPSRARRLENELDSKLAQLCHLDGNTSASPLLQEIEAALQELGEVNDTMSKATGGTASTTTAMHMLQRHREILHDLQQEFTRRRVALHAATERSQLLNSVRADIREHRFAASHASDALLRERNAINASDRATDDIIGQAQATRDALAAQRGGFGTMSSRLRQISNMAPQVNELLGMISHRRKRDKIILGVVIGLCGGILLVVCFG